MPPQELVGAIKRDADNIPANTSRLINCYREGTGEAFPRHVLKSDLGTKAFADVSNVFMRAMREVAAQLYVACGGSLYSVASDGTVTTAASISDGETILSEHGTTLTIAASGVYYTWDGATLSTPTGGAFSNIGSVCFLSDFTFRTEGGGSRFDWTTAGDPTDLDATYFKSAQGANDDILRAEAINGNLVLFKERSREVWYLTGSADATDVVRRVTGGIVETGLKAKLLLTQIDNGVFFVGDDNIAYVTDGLAQKPVSTGAVETNIAQGSPVACGYWEDEGHKMAAIIYSDRPADVIDLTTMEWHERAEGTDLGPWDSLVVARFGNAFYRAKDDGLVEKLVRNNTDVSDEMVRRAVSHTLYFEGGGTIDLIEILGRFGRSDLGRDAQCWLRISRDGGNTWTEEKWRSLGDVGDYRKRARWLAQGWTKGPVTLEITMSDPVECPLFNDFYLEAS